MKNFAAAVLLITSMTGCVKYVPGLPVIDDDIVRDSLVINIDTVSDGHGYEFDFDVQL